MAGEGDVGEESGLREEVVNRAVEHLGVTEDFRDCGFILPDGRMLKKPAGNEEEPHETTSDYLPSGVVDITKISSLPPLLGLGFMRFKTTGNHSALFNFNVIPTRAQIKTMEDVCIGMHSAEFVYLDSNRTNPAKPSDPAPLSIQVESPDIRDIQRFIGTVKRAISPKVAA